jgi:hypothetical protein
MRKLLVFLAVVAVAAVAASSAQAIVYQLTDLNSVFTVDTALAPVQWVVDGQYQLYQQGFWWRLGQEGGEGRLGDLYTSANQPLANFLQVDYNLNPNFNVTVTYQLTGGQVGSPSADLAESIRIHSKIGSNLDMHFFQYADFDLGGTPGDDELAFTNPNLVSQWDNGGSSVLSETVVVPSSSHHEGSLYNTLYNSLENNTPTTLSDNPPIGGGTITGNVVWAFEWDQTIGTTDYIISKDKRLSAVPEPGILVMLGLGLFGVEMVRRRRKSA